MHALRVGVLRGGSAQTSDASFRTGAELLPHMPQGVRPKDIFITRDGEWSVGGVVIAPERVVPHVDVFLSLLHDSYGEGGGVQKFLAEHGARYVGSETLASAHSYQKHLTKQTLATHGIATPLAWLFRAEDLEDLEQVMPAIRKQVAPPWVVKPSGSSYSLGMSLVWDPHKLAYAIEKALFYSEVVLVEEYVRGDEVSVLVTDAFRDQDTYAFFPVHIRSRGSWDARDHISKIDAAHRFECPSHLSRDTKDAVTEMALRVHTLFDARDYSEIEMIVSPAGAISVLEINTVPELLASAPAHAALEAAGVPVTSFLQHLFERAISR